MSASCILIQVHAREGDIASSLGEVYLSRGVGLVFRP